VKRYEVREVWRCDNHAGLKAPDDISDIVRKMQFSNVEIPTERKSTMYYKVVQHIRYINAWHKLYRKTEMASVLLLQNPFGWRKWNRSYVIRSLKRYKKCKIISMIHDVEELRNEDYTSKQQKEFEMMLDTTDVFIVHNSVTKKWFIKRGIEENRIVNLQIFDYLHSFDDKETPRFSKSITIAGNLDSSKSSYIGHLKKLQGVNINLYGPNFDESLIQYQHITYHESLPPEEFPEKVTQGFGLVWDGNSIETCTGSTGKYLRYKNPHKLSFYLASGLPVIIWKQAAEAQFVEENKVSICVDSLYELEDVMKH
jgi:hypothetical protein